MQNLSTIDRLTPTHRPPSSSGGRPRLGRRCGGRRQRPPSHEVLSQACCAPEHAAVVDEDAPRNGRRHRLRHTYGNKRAALPAVGVILIERSNGLYHGSTIDLTLRFAQAHNRQSIDQFSDTESAPTRLDSTSGALGGSKIARASTLSPTAQHIRSFEIAL